MKNSTPYDLVVVGGGAAGFFCAINVALRRKDFRVLIVEKSGKLLSKVRISGGGRCNVTHHCFDPTPLSKHYPRGQKELKKLFREFHAKDTVAWFAKHGVILKTEGDGRMFPKTDRSETIIETFLRLAEQHNITIWTEFGIKSLEKKGERFELVSEKGITIQSGKVLIACGGHPKKDSYEWIAQAGHQIIPPIPSLFTFNDSEKTYQDLMGVAVSNASVKIAGTKFLEQGPVLITHWGLSGPAVIRLSAWAAEYLFEKNYTFTALVNWTGTTSEEEVRQVLLEQKNNSPRKKVVSNPLYNLPVRLWERLTLLAEIENDSPWGELSLKKINKLIEFLIRCPFHIKGKTTFKEEFVTCGGVDWKDVDPETMQSKILPGLFFAGEVLHMDGETGGFNFQAAWTTAWIAAQSIAH